MSNDNGHYRNEPPPQDENIVNLRDVRTRRDHDRAAQQRRDNPPPPHEPLLNLPPLTKYMIGALVLIHVILSFAVDDVTRYWVFEHFGFVPAAYSGHAPLPWWSMLLGPFTYMALHGSWMHLGMNMAMLLAFGSACEKWLNRRTYLAIFILSGVAAALAQFAVAATSTAPLIGASGGLSGLFAAVLLMMHAQGLSGRGKYGLWPFIVVWIMISAGMGMMGGPDGSTIAWPAHIGGFIGGFVLFRPLLRALNR